MTSIPSELIQQPEFLGGVFQEIENAFNELDFRETLSDFLPAITESQSNHFSQRKDSGGSIWPPLSKYTVAKKGHDIPLVETTRLRESVTSQGHPDHIEAVSHRGLLFGTRVEYGIFHQEGAGRIPQRAFLGIESPLVDSVVSGVADHAVESLKFRI